MGKAFASPRRLELLDLLAQGPRTRRRAGAGERAVDANTSQHLQALHAAGMVTRAREGTRVRYALAGEEALRLWLALRDASAARLAEVERAAHDYLGEDVETHRARRADRAARARRRRARRRAPRGGVRRRPHRGGALDPARRARAPARPSCPPTARSSPTAAARSAPTRTRRCAGCKAPGARPAVSRRAGRSGGSPHRQTTTKSTKEERRMSTTERQLDTTELEQRVKGMYQEVALEPRARVPLRDRPGAGRAPRLPGRRPRPHPGGARSTRSRASATSSTWRRSRPARPCSTSAAGRAPTASSPRSPQATPAGWSAST